MIKTINYKYISFAILGAALVWLGAQFDIPLPYTPVPQSGQTLAILLVATLLPKPYGVLSIAFYLLAGLIGLPVFADGGSGWSHLKGTTGGYLLGFLVAGIYLNWSQGRDYLRLFVDFVLSHAIILMLGGLWLSRFVGSADAWGKGIEPFLMGGLLKSSLALLLVFVFRKLKDASNEASHRENLEN